MTVRDFLTALEARPDLPLAFDPGSGPVPPGYHVTEFKSAAVRAVDCGGRASDWSELVLQVAPPARPEARAMTAGRFLTIWERVERQARIDERATVRVETPTPDGVAVSYLVGSIETTAAALTVRLAPPTVACKGADRSVRDIPVLANGDAGELPVVGCCAPASGGARSSAGNDRG